MEINKKILMVFFTFFITAIGAFFLMMHLVNELFRSNLPYETLQEQISTQYLYFINGVTIHYFFFLFIALLGWYYSKRKQQLFAYRKGFLYSIYFMGILGIFYTIIFFYKL